jgi:hypothetical protein
MLIILYCGVFCGASTTPEVFSSVRSKSDVAVLAVIPDVNTPILEQSGKMYGGRRRKVGFDGLYATVDTSNTDGASILHGGSAAPSGAQSVRSARSVSTSVVGNDLDFYRGRLKQKREELIQLVSPGEEQTVYYTKEYYNELGAFYEKLRREVRSICERVIKENENMKRMREESANRGWKLWKASPSDVSKKEKEVNELKDELCKLLAQRPTPVKKAAKFPPAVQNFLQSLQDETTLEDFENMIAREILGKIKETNRIITLANEFISTLQMPFRKCFEKGRWIVSEVQTVNDCGIALSPSYAIFECSSDEETGYSLPILTPIGIESPEEEEEKAEGGETERRPELTREWVERVETDS